MTEIQQKRIQRVKTRSRFTAMLALIFCATLIVPNFGLAYTEGYSMWSNEALILLPLGLYMMMSVALRRSGVMIWVAFPLTFLCAFQIVLLYLFGNSVIATDMFTNVLTTNPGEAGELLSNIYPSVILVVVLYVPLLWLATREIIHRRYISLKARKAIGLSGAIIAVLGALALIPAYHVSEDKHVIRNEIFPFNVCYNISVCAQEFRKTINFAETSRDFTYGATRNSRIEGREVYVYIIGEASRAMSWELFGSERATNPELKQIENLAVFRNVLTQSNTTHKSVPMILSSTSAEEHTELYVRKGLPALFNEVGFETWFFSNQSPQGAMIDHLAFDAQHVKFLEEPRYDMQLLDAMRTTIENSTAQKMLFVLHCYGSHFSYHQRYPREFAVDLPDDEVAISVEHKEYLRNSYHNSIRYTDHFLAQTINYLRSLDDTASALIYCADHGEDLLDDDRKRFLHASPTTTAYQLYVPMIAWMSPRYTEAYPERHEAAMSHSMSPASSHSMFHTMANMASIESPYIDHTVSLVSAEFDDLKPRYYLNDHNEAVPFEKTGLKEQDMEVFRKLGIKP